MGNKKNLLSYLCNAYVFIMVIFFPLFIRNGYYDIMRSKQLLNYVVTAIFLVLSFLYLIISRTLYINKDFKVFYIFTAIYLTSVIAGSFLSSNSALTWIGKGGRYYGSVNIIIWILIMYILANYFSWNAILTWAFTIGCSLVYLLQILNGLNVDPFNVYKNLTEAQQSLFISTLGNLNFNASFNCITMAIICSCYVIYAERLSKIILGTSALLGFLGMLSCRSLSVYLGIGIIFIVLTGYALYRYEKLKDVGLLLFLFALSLLLLKLTYLFNMSFRKQEGLTNFLMNTECIGAVILIAALFVFLGIKNKRNEKNHSRSLKVYMIIIGSIIVVAAAVLVILINTGIFKITDSTGTNRIFIWKRSFITYSKYSVLEKMFGCGTNSFGAKFNELYGSEALSFLNGYLTDTHNEFIQALVTNGLIGLVGYFGMFLTALIYKMKEFKRGSSKAIIGICAILAYLAQGLANNLTIITAPVVFMGLGIILGLRDSDRK